jgi:hypothetical protein
MGLATPPDDELVQAEALPPADALSLVDALESEVKEISDRARHSRGTYGAASSSVAGARG